MTLSAPPSRVALFAPQASRLLGERVAGRLRLPLRPCEERNFEWGHHKTRPLADVRGDDVYVIESLHGDATHTVNDKLCRLLFFLAALRDADAARVTAIVPFLCYSRKDRRTEAWDPVTTRYVAQLFEALGVDRVATIEVHNPAAFENAFRCRTVHIDPAPLLAEAVVRDLVGQELIVVSPDSGGVKRARHFADVVAGRLTRPVPLAFIEKFRSHDVVSGGTVVGDVSGRMVVIIDDLIAGGTTLARAAEACRRAGARGVVAAAAHGAFTTGSSETLGAALVDHIFVLDHIPPTALDPALAARRVRLVDCSGLLADTIAGMAGAAGLPAATAGPPTSRPLTGTPGR